jgi:hypothetical protein
VTPQCWPTTINWATPLWAKLTKREGGFMANALDMVPSPEIAIVTVTAQRRIEAIPLGDYKLYHLPEATDVAAYQTKQVQFLAQSGVAFERVYLYDVEPYDDAAAIAPTDVVLRLQNTKANGLGKPLPAGAISVTETTAEGTAALVGQDRVPDVAQGLPLEIRTGHAIGIRVTRRVIAIKRFLYDKRAQKTFSLDIENDKPHPVAFEVRVAADPNCRLVGEDRPHTLKGGRIVWSFALAPGVHESLQYTIEQHAR